MKDHYEKVTKAGGDPYRNKHRDINSDDDWRYMIDEVWKNDKHQIRSRACKGNRAKVDYNHTGGSKSFPAAMTSKDAPKDDDGVLDFPAFFATKHLKKNKQWVDSKAKNDYNQMVEIQNAAKATGLEIRPEEYSTMVFGEKKKYLKGFGVGPQPPSVRSGATRQPRHEILMKVNEELEEHKRLLEEEKLSRERDREEHKRLLEEKKFNREKDREEHMRLYEQQQQQINTLMAMFKEGQRWGIGLHTLLVIVLVHRNLYQYSVCWWVIVSILVMLAYSFMELEYLLLGLVSAVPSFLIPMIVVGKFDIVQDCA